MKRSEYLKIFNILKQEIIKNDAHLKIYYRKISFSYGTPHYGASGCFKPDLKRVCLTFKGKTTYKSRLAVMAHELRHAMHLKLDLFSDYYDLKYFDKVYQLKIINGEETSLPNLDICLAAENDCNEYAIKFLNEHGITIDPQLKSYSHFFKYDIYKIYHYHYKDILYRLARKNNLKTNHLDLIYSNSISSSIQ